MTSDNIKILHTYGDREGPRAVRSNKCKRYNDGIINRTKLGIPYIPDIWLLI